jgi:hypothetical protein
MAATATTSSPFKTSLKHDSNPHPYPIKTTSTGLLTRSNSSPSPAHDRHHYVPLASPTRPRSGSDAGVNGNAAGPSKGRHRYSRSLTSHFPISLPVPPSPTRSLNSLELEHEISILPRREIYHSDAPGELYDLPPDPQTWSPAQLSTYLATALKSQSGEWVSAFFFKSVSLQSKLT